MWLHGNLYSSNTNNEMELNKQLSFCSYNLKNYDDIIEKIDGAHEKSALEKMFNESTFLILQET